MMEDDIEFNHDHAYNILEMQNNSILFLINLVEDKIQISFRGFTFLDPKTIIL